MQHRSISSLFSVACTFLTSVVFAGPIYNVTNLSATVPGASDFVGYDINNSGEVVGYSLLPGCCTGAIGPMLISGGNAILIGALPGGGNYGTANSINDSGQIVGNSTNGTAERGFLYSNGVMIDIGDLSGGQDGSRATGINDFGVVVGSSYSAVGIRAVSFENGLLKDLGTLPSESEGSAAYAVNNAGQIVGQSSRSTTSHAFLYENGSMFDLGVLPGHYRSSASSINNLGQVVGTSQEVGSASGTAFLYSSQEMKSLGTLPGMQWSEAYDINDFGQIIGISFNDSKHTGFLYRNGEMVTLNDLVDPLEEWNISEVSSINNLGQIVAYGRQGEGRFGTLLLTPITTNSEIPTPSTLLLTALGVTILGSTRSRFLPPRKIVS